MENDSVSDTLLPELEDDPRENLTYGEDPNPMPSELPQSMETNPLEEAYTEPAMEMARNLEEKKQKWQADRMSKIHEAVIDFDNFYPEKSVEARQRAVISGLIKTRMATKPSNTESYNMARASLAHTYFNGKGADNDAQLFEAIKAESESKQANEDLHRNLQRRAFNDAMSGKTFQDYRREQLDMSEARKDSLASAYNEYKSKVREEWGRPMDAIRKVYKSIAEEQDPDKAMEILANADKAANFTDEEHAKFLQLFREVAINNPSPTTDEILDDMGLDAGIIRSSSGYFVKSWDNMKRMAGGVADVGSAAKGVFGDIVQGTPTPRTKREMIMPSGALVENVFSKTSFMQDKKRYSRHKRHEAFLKDAQAILDSDYDPIELHFKEGSTLAAIEEGIYAMPAAVASTAVAAIPVVGLPTVGAIMHGYSRESFRQKLVDAGWDRSEAINTSEKMGAVAAIPNIMLEKVQAGAFFGKIAGFDKAFKAINNKVNNKVARMLARFTAANLAETGIELQQELNEEIVQYYANAMDSRIPDVEWKNGKDGVFDGYFNKFVTTFTSVAPLGMSMAVGGIKAEARAEAFALTPRNVRTMAGVSKEDNDRVDAAETVAEKVAAAKQAWSNLDPNSAEAKAEVDRQVAKANAQGKAISDMQRAGEFPIFRTTKEDNGVVEVVSPTTGEVLDRIDNNPKAAAESAIAYMELETQANQDQLDELAGMIEVAMLDVREAADKGATVELELGSRPDVKAILERFEDSSERVMSQVGRLERLENKEIAEGGDGGMSRAVYGMSEAQFEGEQKSYLQRIFGGTSAMTIVHERGHVGFKRALESGALTLKEAHDFFLNLDKALEGKTDKKGESLRFMPEGTKADDFAAIDEAVAEFSEVMLLQTRNGKKTAMREAVGRQMSAMARAQGSGAGKFKAFYEAMLEFFSKLLSRSVAMRKAVATGKIKETEVEAFRMALQGTTEQETIEQEIDQEVAEILDQGGDPFSIGTAKDAAYMDAVNSGSVETQQRMVDEAAKKAGYSSPRVFHGTNNEFDSFSKDALGSKNFFAESAREGFFFAGSLETAENYTGLTHMDMVGLGLKKDPLLDEAREVFKDDLEMVKRKEQEIHDEVEAELVAHEGYKYMVEQDLLNPEDKIGSLNWISQIAYKKGWGEMVTERLNEAGIEQLSIDVNQRINEWIETQYWERDGRTPHVKQLYLKMENPYIVDAGDTVAGAEFPVTETIKDAKAAGSDGVIFRNMADGADVDTIYVTFEPNQIKSADPVTYDADGNVIPLSQRFDPSRDEIAFSVGAVPKEIAEAKEPIVEQIYIKETKKFKEGVASGRIKTDADIQDFIGKHLVMHQPDTAMAGEVRIEGESFVKGKGGVYYPVLFSDEGYFWASTAAKADEMAKALNQISEQNGGSIYMALTSADVDKLFSSTTMSVGTMNFFKTLTRNPKKYGITKEELNTILRKASEVKIVKKTLIKDKNKQNVLDSEGRKTYRVQVQEFGYTLKEDSTLDETVAELEKWLQPQNKQKTTGSIFPVRKQFVWELMTGVSNHLKKKPKESLEVSKLLTHESNKYAKGKVRKGELSPAAFTQGLGDMLSEPLTKTFQQFGDEGKGYIYAVIEIKGKVKSVDAKEHESYPKAIVSAEGNMPVVHVMKKGYHWTDVIQEKDTGARVERTNAKMTRVFPTGGFSAYKTRPIQFGSVQEGAEGVDLSFSIGDAKMKDTIVNDAMKRMRDPEGVAVVLANIVERVSNLKREVPKIIKAFGKEVEQKAIVDPRLIGELKSDAARMRREAIEDAENAVYDKYGDILDNDSLVKLADQPVTELILAEGGLMSLSQAKRNKGDEAMTAGEFEEAAGLPPMYYGGSQSPDQMAQQLADEGVIRDSDVSTMMEAIESEMTSVTNRKQDLKDAKAMLKDEKAKARQTSKEWLDERIAEQKRDYNPMARAKRALVTLSALRTALPMEIRGKIGGDVKLLTTGSDEKRLEYLQKTLAKLDKELEKYVKGKANEQIDKVFKSLKNAKLTPDTQQTLADIQKYSEMSQESVDERIEEIGIAMEQTQAGEGLEELEAELINLSAFGARSSMNAAQLQVFLDNIISIKNLGKTIRQVRDAEYKAMIEEKKEMVNSEVTGGKGKMSAYESKYVKDRENKIFAKLKDFHFKNISFEWLLNAAVRADKNVGTLKSRTHNTFATMVHRATHNEKRFKRDEHLEYSEKMGEIFGAKGVALANKIESKMMRSKDTGVTRLEYEDGATEKVKFQMKNLNAVLDGSAKAESYGWSDADLEAAKAARDEELEKRNARRKTPIDALPATAKLSFSRQKAGKEVKIRASQSEAIALIMMYRQDGIRESMINEGYTEEAMEALENDYLTDEGRQVMEWLTEKYEENYHVVNEVYRAQYGVNLPKVEFYAPVRRVIDRQKDADMKIDDYGNNALSTKPSFLFGRVTNYNEIDTDVDALTLYSQHMSQTHHYVAWADTIKQLRSVFNDKNVRKNIIDYAGKNLMKGIDTRIDWMADGGNRNAWHSKMLDKLRLAHTFSSLSYNIGVGLKQLTSLPAYAFDMPLHEYAKYQAMFFSDVKKHWSEMWALDYVQTRFKEGYDRDVAEGIRTKGDSYMSRYVMKGLQTGMLVGKTGDITPVIIGGWAAKRRAYDKAIANGMSKKEAEAYSIEVFEMTTDRAQQAVDQKDMGYYQNAGSLFKVFTMYKTSPRQYYANTSEAILDAMAGKKGATKEAARRMFISQIILPVMFQFATDSWKMLGDEDKEYEPEDYARAILLGSLNGLFLVGEAAASLASVVSDAKVWQLQMTLFDSVNDLIWAINKMKNKDFLQGVDELAEAMGKIYPSPLTFYKIIKQRGKDVPDWD